MAVSIYEKKTQWSGKESELECNLYEWAHKVHKESYNQDEFKRAVFFFLEHKGVKEIYM